MFIPLLKISVHYSASDRARKVRKIKIKKRKQWGLAKKIKPPKKRKFKKEIPTKKSLKKKVQKKRVQKKKSL
ncbi:hypothetical protein DDP44_04490 [Helicobacter pylori]|nr:hypothetical protein DDP44_04490 [Helicobacter pylori]